MNQLSMDLLEMTKLKRNYFSTDQTNPHEDPQNSNILRSLEAKCAANPVKVFGIFVGCFLGFYVYFSVLKNPSSSGAEVRLLDFKPFTKAVINGESKAETTRKWTQKKERREKMEEEDAIQHILDKECCYKLFSSDVLKMLDVLNAYCKLSEELIASCNYPLPDVASGEIAKQNMVVGDNFSRPFEVQPQDKLLGGLLPAGLDENSCLSRYQSVLYRKRQIGLPSSDLISRLRNYEALHKRCGPLSESYNRTLEYLKLGQYNMTGCTGCNYLVWISYSGLGNKMLTLASAFLYALLTNRVLLVDPGGFIPDLFCEPFPEASWLLPSDFPITHKFNSFDQKSPESYGNILKNNVLHNSSSLPPYIYLHLLHDYDKNDMLFFCDQAQTTLQKVPWLIMKSNNYFIPSLFLISSFEQELNHLFPEKGAVFHFLGWYLFHPTNSVWGLITRYYNTYLAKADEKIGIQIRVLEKETGPFRHVLDQILACVMKENLLPQLNDKENVIFPSGKPNKTVAVLMTSLSSGYFEAVRDMYWEHPTVTGEVIEVYQPSQEEYQHTEEQMHNMKAWAEIYLLSLTDNLVTSAWSTFGYVAQSFGGLKPWILYMPENHTAPDPPCQRAVSMEPCFHAPPTHDCQREGGIDTGKLVPHVQHCEDRSWGIKLVDRDNVL